MSLHLDKSPARFWRRAAPRSAGASAVDGGETSGSSGLADMASSGNGGDFHIPALEAMLDISVTYSQDRVAFERPISKFQAVQHNLARLAGEVAAAVCAAASAADALQRAGTFDNEVFFEIAAAKIRVGEAAGEGAGIAHQVHGAIGFTMEHILQRYSRRVWSWRDEFGSESAWAVRLGEAVAANGGDELWASLAAR